MNEIREIVTRAVVAKGKKVFNLTEQVKTHEKPYSILGCWIINHQFEAELCDNVVNINGTYEINIWYAYDNNTKTDIARQFSNYNQTIKIREIVQDLNSDCRDVIVRVAQQPTVTNGAICDNLINVDIIIELLAEVIGETKIKVSIFDQFDPSDPYEEEDFENQINEDFINQEILK